MLIQSVLFFILGIAATALVLVLLAPALWRRAIYLARKAIASDLPLTLDEIEADRDFLRARQAVEIVKRDEKYDGLLAKFAHQKLELDSLKEQIYQLANIEQHARLLDEKLADTSDELANERRLVKTLHRFKGKTLNEIRDIMKEERQAQVDEMKKDEELKNLQQEIVDLQQKLAASLRKNEKDCMTKHQIDEFREEILNIAAAFTAKTAIEEGPSSPIIDLVKKSRGKKSLSARIKNDLSEQAEKNAAHPLKKQPAKSARRAKRRTK
ncbi:hypothetical protein [uncultured Bartonella sp.]|uniref:hypothetical protein n=1 Tax=uncultured Bartonella sp. TaxID=104108 RepID=UPI002620886E|nr:hypothetical protein [uncultured Bartonella sp.]